MSDKQAPPAKGNIAPPSQLPSLFTEQKRTADFKPPVPPQLHYFPTLGSPAAPPSAPPLPSQSLTDVSSSQDNSQARASPQPQAIAVGMNEVSNALDKLEEGEEPSVLGWFQKAVAQSSFLSKVADKAKTGMDSVLTTLDPGMRDFLTSDGAVDMCIASDDERLITAVADGFRRLFSSVEVRGMGTPGASKLLSQIIGHSLAMQYAKERISLLRSSGLTGSTNTLVAFQPFLHTIDECWYESAVLVLQSGEVLVHVFTQPVQVDEAVISKLKEHTPAGFAENAFATSVGSGYAEVFGIESDDWQQHTLQFSSSEIYRLAATALAALFKRAVSAQS